MKNSSFFSQIILLIIISAICVILTVGIAFFAGTYTTALFDLSKLNLSNMIPVLIFGGFISCVIIGITVVVISREVFIKIKNYISENIKNN